MALDETIDANEFAHDTAHTALRAEAATRGVTIDPLTPGVSSLAAHRAVHQALHTNHNLIGAVTVLPTGNLIGTPHPDHHEALHKAYNLRIGGAQSAVVLTAADGEIVSGSTQSNFIGNGWATRNGFTRAANWTGTNPLGSDYAGFDDPRFLPVVTWLTDFSGTSFYARMDDLGINGMLPAAGSVSLANNITYEKWAVTHDTGAISSGDDPGVWGISTGEEPSTEGHYESIIADATAWLAGSEGAGRFHLFNFADNLLQGDIDGIYDPADMVLGRDDTHPSPQPQFTTCDQYWFAGAPNDAGGSRTKLDYRMYGGLNGGPYNQTQTARGSHYGSMMDSIRKNYSGTTTPIGIWIENGAPYTEVASAEITPAQMKWAIWSTIVHGARGIYYFNHTFRVGDPLLGNNNFANNGYGGPGVVGTGIYAAAKEINLNALAIASVINSPIDGYFVFGDFAYPNMESAGQISTAGFLMAVTSTNIRGRFTGVDASCRWQPVEGKHYIFATTREPESATSIPVTYRMVDQGQTVAHPMFAGSDIAIDRGGAIPGGFCEFSDTFATAASYKAYRID